MTLPSPALVQLMTRIIDGEASVEELARQIEMDAQTDRFGGAQMERIEGATVDLGRKSRCGFGEVIYGEGKSVELVCQIIRTQLAANQSALVTRIESGAAFQVRQHFQNSHHNPIARTLRVGVSKIEPAVSQSDERISQTPHVAILSAGSTDATVAEEAFETVNWMGVPSVRFEDVGVAGPQRLLSIVPQLQQASAVVVVAGMEGALPSVVGGYVAAPVFAVPTSVGYGAAMGGLTPLMGMLTCCAPNVAVVNVDAGFQRWLSGRLGGRPADTPRDSQPN